MLALVGAFTLFVRLSLRPSNINSRYYFVKYSCWVSQTVSIDSFINLLLPFHFSAAGGGGFFNRSGTAPDDFDFPVSSFSFGVVEDFLPPGTLAWIFSPSFSFGMLKLFAKVLASSSRFIDFS